MKYAQFICQKCPRNGQDILLEPSFLWLARDGDCTASRR
jgi:hypothetical protein